MWCSCVSEVPGGHQSHKLFPWRPVFQSIHHSFSIFRLGPLCRKSMISINRNRPIKKITPHLFTSNGTHSWDLQSRPRILWRLSWTLLHPCSSKGLPGGQQTLGWRILPSTSRRWASCAPQRPAPAANTPHRKWPFNDSWDHNHY